MKTQYCFSFLKITWSTRFLHAICEHVHAGRNFVAPSEIFIKHWEIHSIESNKILVCTWASKFFDWPNRFLVNATEKLSCNWIFCCINQEFVESAKKYEVWFSRMSQWTNSLIPISSVSEQTTEYSSSANVDIVASQVKCNRRDAAHALCSWTLFLSTGDTEEGYTEGELRRRSGWTSREFNAQWWVPNLNFTFYVVHA